MSAKRSTAPAKKAPAKKTAAKRAGAPAKKAAKPAPKKDDKPAAKKAAKPATKKDVVRLEDPSKYNPIVLKPRVTPATKLKMLGQMTENIRKSFEILNERSAKRPVVLFTPAMLRRNIIPYQELPFQWMLASLGFRYPCAIEIIAPEKMGSTTFVMDWISRLLDIGCYSVYCECEGKQMSDRRIMRLMDRDPEVAVAKINAIEWTKARSLSQFEETLRQTVKDLRKRCDTDPETKGNPIFFFVDPWGALMSKGEAKGNMEWGLAANAKKEAPKDTAEGSNFEHAKYASGMARWLPAFMEEFNCTVVFLNKQNDKIDMKPIPGPSFMAPSPMKNDTRIGGHALKRLSAYRMTMMKLADIRAKDGDKEVYGHHLRIMLISNSYGPRDRFCDATLYFDRHEDRGDWLAPGFTFDDRTAAWLVSRKFLGTTVEKDLYTCDALGCVAVSAPELMATLRAHPEHIEFLGGQLDIEGYAREVAHMVPKEEEDADDDDEAAYTAAAEAATRGDELVQDEEEEPGLVPDDAEPFIVP